VKKNSLLKDFFGAFADGAILFPLIASLSLTSGFSGPVLLASAGIAYLVSGFLFRVPMSVQPLKSIAIAAIVMGASQLEVRVSGALLALFCLSLLIFDIEQWIKKIPSQLVHGVQFSLGVLLVVQGLKPFLGNIGYNFEIVPVIALCALVLFFPRLSGIPILGLVATVGLIFAIYQGYSTDGIPSGGIIDHQQEFRPYLILSLVLPQLVLTLSNSVIGTADVCKRYFKDQANLVTERRLLQSIGFGNLLSSAIGGLPFCHGAGGVTAHFQGGARTWRANIIIGVSLLLFGLIQTAIESPVIHYSKVLMAVLLISIGIMHLKLARPTWQSLTGKLTLLSMGLTVVLTHNLLWSLGSGVLVYNLCVQWFKKDDLNHNKANC
jgi:hypothetical protein